MSSNEERIDPHPEPRYLLLNDATRIAGEMAIAWQLETWAAQANMQYGMFVRSNQRPSGVSVLSSGLALETSHGVETDDGEFEYALHVPSSNPSVVLVLSNAHAQREVRLLLGDDAAVAAHGFRAESAGRRAPVCVLARDFRRALAELTGVS